MGYVSKGKSVPIERSRSIFPIDATINAVLPDSDWCRSRNVVAKIEAVSWDKRREASEYRFVYLTAEDIRRVVPILIEAIPLEERQALLTQALLKADDSELLTVLESLFAERLNRKGVQE